MSGVAALVVREHKEIFCYLFFLFSRQGGRGSYSRQEHNDDEEGGFRGR